MGYLNNTVVTVDAIITKKGRQLIAENPEAFKVTQFALADDEIDYSLWNPNHPSGSLFYGEAIENLPVLEAFPDESQLMKSKLMTAPRGTSRIPVIRGINAISAVTGERRELTPTTSDYLDQTSSIQEPLGYKLTIADRRFITNLQSDVPVREEIVNSNTTRVPLSRSIIGNKFSFDITTSTGIFLGQNTAKTTITIEGLNSGASIMIPLTVSRLTAEETVIA